MKIEEIDAQNYKKFKSKPKKGLKDETIILTINELKAEFEVSMKIPEGICYRIPGSIRIW